MKLAALLFLFAQVSALSVNGLEAAAADDQLVKVSRFDVQDVWNKHLVERVDFEVPVLRSALKSQSSSLTASPFLISFKCDASVTLCNKAYRVFNSSTARIASQLRINTPVVVQATFKSFCDGASSCSLSNVLGQATSASYFAAKGPDSNSVFMYPQALVKQLNLNKQLNYSAYDIIAEFNSDFNFWFKEDGPISANQTDFEFVVSHELTHGLGFDTQWVQWNSVISSAPFNIPSNFLAPFFTAKGSPTQDQGTYIVSSWQPLNVFDGFVLQSSTGTPMMNFANSIYGFNPNGRTALGFIKDFLSSGSPFTAAQQVFSSVSGGNSKVKFSPPARILGANATANGLTSTSECFLYTSGAYSAGSSIAHVDYQSYYKTLDFLMIPAVSELTGLTLDQIIQQNAGSTTPLGIYGPKTLQTLASIGWPTVLNDQVISINVQDTISINSASGASVSLMLLLLCIILSL